MAALGDLANLYQQQWWVLHLHVVADGHGLEAALLGDAEACVMPAVVLHSRPSVSRGRHRCMQPPADLTCLWVRSSKAEIFLNVWPSAFRNASHVRSLLSTSGILLVLTGTVATSLPGDQKLAGELVIGQ